MSTTTTTAHTPTPWTFAPAAYAPGSFRLFRRISIGTTTRTRRLDDGNGGFSEADARLIAAATELLEVLRAVARRWDKYDEEDAPELGEQIRDAIHKATGDDQQ
jgi:hypothetical protein